MGKMPPRRQPVSDQARTLGFGKQVVVSVTLADSDAPVTATFRAEAVVLAA